MMPRKRMTKIDLPQQKANVALHGYQINFLSVNGEIIDCFNTSGILLAFHLNECDYDSAFEFNFQEKTSVHQVQFLSKDIKNCILYDQEPAVGLRIVKKINKKLRNIYLVVYPSTSGGYKILRMFIGLEPPTETCSSTEEFCEKIGVKEEFSSLRFRPTGLALDISVYMEVMARYGYPGKEEFIKLLESKNFSEKYLINDLKDNVRENKCLFAQFLWNHKCDRNDCGEFTFLKCNGCKFLHYCSKKCQVKEWHEEHRKICLVFGQYTTLELQTFSTIKRIIKHELKKEVVTLKAAIKRIKFLIFKLNVGNDALVKECLEWKSFSLKSNRVINPNDKKYLKLLEGV